jgi:hypothetical protein
MQKITLKNSKSPIGVKAFFSKPFLLTPIPYEGERIINNVSFIISASEGAIATNHRIDLLAFCQRIHRLEGIDHEEAIEFTIKYTPYLKINAPVVSITPRNETSIIPINVTNCGNYKTRVSGNLIEFPNNFNISMIPPHIILDIDEKEQFYCIVQPPSDFIGYELIKLNFNAQRYPIKPGTQEENYTIYLFIKVI